MPPSVKGCTTAPVYDLYSSNDLNPWKKRVGGGGGGCAMESAQGDRGPQRRPDPMAIATDAFTLNWAELKTYAIPPWNLIGRVLAKTRLPQAELVLVAPVWKAQGWCPVFLEMLVEVPLLIPLKQNLITATHEDSLPKVVPQLAV